jgi:hypothetical protein
MTKKYGYLMVLKFFRLPPLGDNLWHKANPFDRKWASASMQRQMILA